MAPMKAACRGGRCVTMLQPRAAGMFAVYYEIEGICRECSAADRLSLP